MARPLRIQYPGAVYHVIARGNERREIFLDDNDFMAFLGILEKACNRLTLRVHAYSLMTNHYHLLVETPLSNLSKSLHWIQTCYSQYFNRRHNRIGHLFHGRCKTLVVQKGSYLIELGRYIHRNPVRAGMVRYPWEYPWSSCRELLGMAPMHPWLDWESTLRCFGDDLATQRGGYREFVAEEPSKKFLMEAEAQSFVGGPAFVDAMKAVAAVFVKRSREYPLRRSSRKSRSVGEVLEVIKNRLGLTPEGFRTSRFSRDSRRSIAAFLLWEYAGMTQREIGTRCGLSYSGVGKSLKTLASQIDKDPLLRERLAEIESELGSMRTAAIACEVGLVESRSG